MTLEGLTSTSEKALQELLEANDDGNAAMGLLLDDPHTVWPGQDADR